MTQYGDEDLKTVLLGSIPKQEDLYCLIGILRSSPKNKTNLSNKAYQNQIFKCRCLIFSEVEVIASPVLGAVHKIHIIVSRQFYRSGKLQHHLDKLNIMAQEPLPVDNVVYELCLRYTVTGSLGSTLESSREVPCPRQRLPHLFCSS
ncbi:uncharacterized protein C18orf63-like [Homalodisca vitripennis]|uniref:uncharacterized protein C18orf63-like n=1 Tax=Homalodisca vitripennis TaxID=197043 RepID=UPI001EEC1DA6|nr:uncharacterized protein C18orf63-like [Homalodisca vitripennis]